MSSNVQFLYVIPNAKMNLFTSTRYLLHVESSWCMHQSVSITGEMGMQRL